VFLVTTSNQDYWNKDERILFLGEWCKLYSQKHVWQNLQYETLPYLWDELEGLNHHCTYIESLNEKYLKKLTSSLNDTHDEDYSLRYWRILLSPWLSFFIGIIYERYLSIQSAINSNKVTHTWIPPLNYERWITNDTMGFTLRAIGDNDFNLFLYGEIISKVGGISFEYKEGQSFFDPLDSMESQSLTLPARAKKNIVSLLEEVSKKIPSRFNQIVFSSSGLSYCNQVKLQLSLGQIPYLASSNVIPNKISMNKDMRELIKLPQPKNEFESILNDLLIKQLPTLFLEGYSAMRSKSLEAFPKKPKVIFTAYDFAFHDSFKFWAATQTEQGAKIVHAQHGGFYGMNEHLQSQNSELQICDKYFTWGWKFKEQPKTVPMAGGKLQGANYNIKSDPSGKILFVTTTAPIIFVRFDHITNGGHGLDYFLGQERFLNVLFPEVSKMLLMRFRDLKYHWDGLKRLADIYPSIKMYKGKESMHSQLRKSRLCLHDYLGTTWLETLSMNFPTIVFWDPKSVNILKSTQPYLDDLRRVGILHDTPESAAKLVNEIYEDPMSWWSSPDIQEVRGEFCQQFARTSDQWVSQWKEELLKIAGNQKSRNQ
jgi:putative transferase (TIGR04331 family)